MVAAKGAVIHQMCSILSFHRFSAFSPFVSVNSHRAECLQLNTLLLKWDHYVIMHMDREKEVSGDSLSRNRLCRAYQKSERRQQTCNQVLKETPKHQTAATRISLNLPQKTASLFA